MRAVLARSVREKPTDPRGRSVSAPKHSDQFGELDHDRLVPLAPSAVTLSFRPALECLQGLRDRREGKRWGKFADCD